MKIKTLLCTVTAIIGHSVVFSTSTYASDAANLLKNGNFKETFESGLPTDWKTFSHPTHLKSIDSSVSVIQDGDTSFLQVVRNTDGAGQYGEQVVDLAASVGTVYVSTKVRGRDLIPGGAGWQQPGIVFTWILPNDEQREIGPDRWLLLKQSSDEWVALESTLQKPEGVIGLRVAIQGIGWTGELEIQEVTIEPMD